MSSCLSEMSPVGMNWNTLIGLCGSKWKRSGFLSTILLRELSTCTLKARFGVPESNTRFSWSVSLRSRDGHMMRELQSALDFHTSKLPNKWGLYAPYTDACRNPVGRNINPQFLLCEDLNLGWFRVKYTSYCLRFFQILVSIEDGQVAKLPQVKNFFVCDFTNISFFSLS